MSLIYITGIAGSGKSTVQKELVRRGFEAHEGDDELSAFYNNATNEKVQRPKSASERTPEWRENHTWKMSKDKLAQLKERSKSKPIFICGVSSNEEDLLELFDTVIALDVDEATLMTRINSRPLDAFGHSEHEKETLKVWQKKTKSYYEKIGAIVIDTTKPLNDVVDEILTETID